MWIWSSQKPLRKTSWKRQTSQGALKEIDISFIFPFAFDPFLRQFWTFSLDY
jgi:hypothetical protein